MGIWKMILIGIAILAVGMVGFIIWYRAHYSMSPAREFEVNSGAGASRVLIATQGSSFKDSIVAGVVAHLKQRPAYIKVIDVSGLPAVNEADWNAIVVIHTWEMRRPQADARKFVDGARDTRKLVVVSTSGAGTFKMDGVDTITSASVMTDVPARVAAINRRVDGILDSHDRP